MPDQAVVAPDPWFRRPAFIAAAIFFVALAIRLLGIGWGLPKASQHYSLHPDEWDVAFFAMQIEPSHGDFDPGFYNYGTLYLTMVRVAGDVGSAYFGRGAEALWQTFGVYHASGRSLSALAGAGTALFVFLILRRVTNRFGACFGGAAMAVLPGHAVHSRFQTVDVTATFFLVVSAWFALRLLPSQTGVVERFGRWSDTPLKLVAWAGLFAGLSAGTKYTGILGLATLLAAIALVPDLRKGPSGVRLAAVGVGTAILAFLLTTPGVFLSAERFWSDFAYEMSHTSSGHGVVFAATPSGYVYHVLNLVEGMGPLLALLSIVALAWAAATRQPWALALLAFFLLYYLLIGRAEVKFLRYTFPLAIALTVAFGWMVGKLHEATNWTKALVIVALAAVAGLDGGGLRNALTTAYAMSRPDPREQAATYLREEAVRTPGIVVGLVSDPWFYSPTLFPESAIPRRAMALMASADRDRPIKPAEYLFEAMAAANAPRVTRYLPPNIEERFDWDVRLLTETRPEYVAFSGFEYLDLLRLRNATGLSGEIQVQVDRCREFETVLRKDYDLAKQFGEPATWVHDLQYVRPMVWVWKRKSG
ncbi:MAG: glycosyltransferase family 39 protein [Fimbriimonadaceae bacterium]|nr:glycosyltransferase family 39 protein [Fimbriimonadaceae bacterium]